ncbi:hypothetical protein Hanom_Chr02g00126131 [Helianthus anomalus]
MRLGLITCFVLIVVFLVFARLNEEIAPREKHGNVFLSGNRIVGFRFTTRRRFLQVIMLWSAAAMVEAHIYVISGTIPQWYFSTDDVRVKQHTVFSKDYTNSAWGS